MAERSVTALRWMYGFAFTGLCAVLMLIHLVPLSNAPGRIPGPDIMLCLTLAWVLRRPHYVPAPIVAGLFLMADMLFLRPLGLWAALVLVAVEYFRARAHNTREQTFLTEWFMVAAVLLIITLVNRLTLAVFFVEQPSLGLTLVQFLATLLAYPLVVFASSVFFGITKMSASEAEGQGSGP